MISRLHAWDKLVLTVRWLMRSLIDTLCLYWAFCGGFALIDCQVPGEEERILQKLHSNHIVWSSWSVHFFCNYLNWYALLTFWRDPFELWDRDWIEREDLHLICLVFDCRNLVFILQARASKAAHTRHPGCDLNTYCYMYLLCTICDVVCMKCRAFTAYQECYEFCL